MKITPKIKKDLESFILDERGDISKQTLISFGALVAGLQAVSLFSQAVSGQAIQARHDHCDPGAAAFHGNSTGHGSDVHANVDPPHSSGTAHSSADGEPAAHCSWTDHGSADAAHCSGYTGGHTSIHCQATDHASGNAAHQNAMWLIYG